MKQGKSHVSDRERVSDYICVCFLGHSFIPCVSQFVYLLNLVLCTRVSQADKQDLIAKPPNVVTSEPPKYSTYNPASNGIGYVRFQKHFFYVSVSSGTGTFLVPPDLPDHYPLSVPGPVALQIKHWVWPNPSIWYILKEKTGEIRNGKSFENIFGG